ncbi:translation initiation factor IF-2-like [Panicum virgatum]|uniref:translation initiation factor IF-2-like n=1 Tax=Panicum virgatum TaxID=38727 RepID=UPI0019D64EE0|nr:translation initiation factor IF-2-like [Panicum virgatum]
MPKLRWRPPRRRARADRRGRRRGPVREGASTAAAATGPTRRRPPASWPRARSRSRGRRGVARLGHGPRTGGSSVAGRGGPAAAVTERKGTPPLCLRLPCASLRRGPTTAPPLLLPCARASAVARPSPLRAPPPRACRRPCARLIEGGGPPPPRRAAVPPEPAEHHHRGGRKGVHASDLKPGRRCKGGAPGGGGGAPEAAALQEGRRGRRWRRKAVVAPRGGGRGGKQVACLKRE